MLFRSKVLASVAMAAVIVACGSSSSRTTFDNAGDTPDAGPAPPAPQLGDGTRAQLNDVELSGTVYAPNGSLPISNALVYITPDEPAAIPEGTYCDTCVALPEDSFTLSTADGSFTWKTQVPNGEFFFVVQKGQFRRVRKIKIDKSGAIEVKKEMTTLPGRRDVANGDDIPRMAVLKDTSYFDKIDQSLDKLGIEGVEVLADRKLLENPAELAKYHIVFVPCGAKDSPQVTNAKVKANIRDYVAKGGKFYVTDWSYEYVRQPFPGYIAWEGEMPAIGSAATGSKWDGPAQAADQGLGDWLGATGDSTFDVEGSYTDIKAVKTVQGLDADGNAASVTPKVWVTAKKAGATAAKPTTVSFEHQCGRVLFSTYHTEASFEGTLHAQEKALLYVLLEVGVCIGEQGGPK